MKFGRPVGMRQIVDEMTRLNMDTQDAQKKSTRQMIRVLGFSFLGFFLLLSCLLTYLHFSSRPPRDSEVIANFHAHRRAFEPPSAFRLLSA
jgi:hypothetical protein